MTVADAWLAAGARDRAIACLEKASGAGDAEVRRRLVALHREDGNVARVAELLVEEAGATPERSARAARLGEADPVAAGYALAFQRAPSPTERPAAEKLIRQHGREAFARALLNANELIFLD